MTDIFRYSRRYTGPIEAVILDWAGTTMDFGCMAPAVVFTEVYKRQNVPITMEEARAPMGAHKRVHIQKIGELDSVRERWTKEHGKAPVDEDVGRMFQDFVPLQEACLSEYSELIPGTIDAIKEIRKRGAKIGSTTGYLPGMMQINLDDAIKQGYEPDATVCAGDVPAGRPYPYMCLKNVIDLGVMCVQSCVKVDDTVPGVEEGLNAGMWTVGFSISGNEVGLSLKDWNALPEDEKATKRARAIRNMQTAGAHYVVDSIADLIPCLDDIQDRISRGESP